MSHISDLPTETLQKIFSYLHIKERFKFERVCRRWQQNVFSSIKCLATDNSCDVFHGYHQHVISAINTLPANICYYREDAIMKGIIAKCGRNMRLYCALLYPDLMDTIVEYCPHLHCIDLFVHDFDSQNKTLLETFGKTYGKQLTCATFHFEEDYNISSFLLACTNLSSLAVMPRRNNEELTKCYIKVQLFDPTEDRLPPCLQTIQNLVIETKVTIETVAQIAMFTNLKMVSIALDAHVHNSPQWASLLCSWCHLNALSLDIDDEISYSLFETLPPRLNYLALHAQLCTPMLISTVCKLKTLKIYMLAMSSTELHAVVQSACHYCPELQHFSIGFDDGLCYNIDEFLLILISFTSLKQLSLGDNFRISDSFASMLLTKLEHLTSFGSSKMSFGFWNYYSLIPTGPIFWKTFKEKAISRPSEHFCVIGRVSGAVQLVGRLPSNLSLLLE